MRLMTNKKAQLGMTSGIINKAVGFFVLLVLGVTFFVMGGQFLVALVPSIVGVFTNFAGISQLPLLGTLFGDGGAFYYLASLIVIIFAIVHIVSLMKGSTGGGK